VRAALREARVPILVAVLMRAALALGSGATANRFPDGPDYVHIAVTLATQGRYPEEFYFARPPLYPLLLTPWGVGGPVAVVIGAKLLNLFLGAATTVLAFRFLRHRGEEPARWAAWSVALHPTLLVASTWVATEVLYATLLLAALLALARLEESPRLSRGVASGILLGLCVLTRPQALMLVPGLLLVAAIWLLRRVPWRIRVRCVAASALAAAITIAPWTARNWFRHGEFLLVSDGGGLMFVIANSDWGFRYQQVASPGEYRSLERELLGQEIPSRLAATSRFGPATRDRVLFRAGFEWIRRHPTEFVVTTLRRLRHFCAPWVSSSAYSARLAMLSACWFAPLFLFGFAGLVSALSRREGGAALVGTVAAITILTVGALFHSVQRYRIPSIDLYLGLFGAAWLAERSGRLRRVGGSVPRLGLFPGP